jgi:thioredoxin 1
MYEYFFIDRSIMQYAFLSKFLFLTISIITSASLFPLQQVSSVAEFNTILQNNEIVLVDFFMPGCGPCARLHTTLEQIINSQEFQDITFIKVDITKVSELSKQFAIRSVPVIKIFKNGNTLYTHVGTLSANELKKELNKSRK